MMLAVYKGQMQSPHRASTLLLIETSINTFANRADPDQTALVRAA